MSKDMPAADIDVRNIVKRYGEVTALNKVTFSVKEGEFFGLLGPNGAGKTTLIKIISTLLKPTEGDVYVGRKSVIDHPEEVKSMIGVVSHNAFLYEELSSYENLDFYMKLYGINDEEKIWDVLEIVDMVEFANEKVYTLSSGMKKRVSIGKALLHKPKILLLDEPTSGLDPISAKKIRSLIKHLNKDGTTVFLTTHHLSEAESLCNRVAIMNRGQVIFLEYIEEIKDSLEDVFLNLIGE
ncbi:MAG: heme ABC exporter ATP-binding protein CcmA [Candidatus Hydrothermarchaeota archaeon]